MKSRFQKVLLAGLLAGALIQTSGCCTLIGYGIGAALDSEKPKGQIPRQQWASLSPGTGIKVETRGGAVFQTHFEVLSGDQIQVEPGPPPLTDAGIHELGRGLAWIPCDSIRTIEVPAHAAEAGLVLGLCVDAIAVGIALSRLDTIGTFDLSGMGSTGW